MSTSCLPVTVLAGSEGQALERTLDFGAHDYLRKPVRTRSLVARVRAVLERVSS